MVDAWCRLLVQVDAWLMHGLGYWYRFTTMYLTVTVTVVPSFYLYVMEVGWGKDRWL
jgi:hypothetical protein